MTETSIPDLEAAVPLTPIEEEASISEATPIMEGVPTSQENPIPEVIITIAPDNPVSEEAPAIQETLITEATAIPQDHPVTLTTEKNPFLASAQFKRQRALVSTARERGREQLSWSTMVRYSWLSFKSSKAPQYLAIVLLCITALLLIGFVLNFVFIE